MQSLHDLNYGILEKVKKIKNEENKKISTL